MKTTLPKKYKNRRIKVHYKSISRRGNPLPWINLSGLWLEDLGFKVGDSLQITVRDRLLIIELLDFTPEEKDYKEAFLTVKKQLKELIR